MLHIRPCIQSTCLFGEEVNWRHLDTDDWQQLHLPAHLADQVFRVLVSAVEPARFFEITVSEQCPKNAYARIAQGVRKLGLPMVVLNLVHARSPNAHLIFWSESSPITFHHLDLDFSHLSRLDREVVACLDRATPTKLDRLFRLKGGQRLHEDLFRTLKTHLEVITCRDERARYGLIDLVLKLVFLIFVQRKSWLNFDPCYLESKMAACHSRGLSIVTCFFKPLFARLEGGRAREPISLGSLPRLGGGLFVFQSEHLPPISNDWCLKLYETLVSQYSFSLFEAREDHAVVGVSPEVLGHVFENLLRSEDRKLQGTFYTPAHVAEKQVEKGFAILLGTPGEQQADRLRKLRILDPSCGSGTYLVAAFQVLLKHRLACTPAEERYNGKLFALKRQIVQENLFGVDINPMAVRLAEVRLWLNMIGDLEIGEPNQAPALPNLQHHLRPGDFLARYEPKTVSDVAKWPKYGRLEKLRHKFPNSLPGQRCVLLKHIYRLEKELFEFLLAREDEEQRQVVRTQLAQQTLPGFSADEPEAVVRVEDSGIFLHAVFSDVFLEGGFDLIVGNPPWLSATRISDKQKQRFRSGLRPPQGFQLTGQVDLSLYFLGACLNLLKPGGHLGFLLPGKLLQARYGQGPRRYLEANTRIDYLFDYGIDHQYLFRADTFPVALGLTLTPPQMSDRVQIERHGHNLFQAYTVAQELLSGPSGAWLLEQWAGQSNRDWPRLKQGLWAIHRGIVTNAKKHFVFKDHPQIPAQAHLRPLLRGRDIGDTRVAPGNWIYWPFDLGPDWYSKLEEDERLWLQKTNKLRGQGLRSCLSYRSRELGAWLVAWKYLSTRWQVTLIRNQNWIPDQTTYYIDFSDFETAYRYFVFFNSNTANRQLASLAERGKDHCFFYYAHTCGELALPPDLMTRSLLLPEPGDVLTPAEGRQAAEKTGWNEPLPKELQRVHVSKSKQRA